MDLRDTRLVFFGKLLIAAVAVVTLVSVAARQLLPSLTIGELLLYSAVGVVAIMALVIAAAICSLQFSQFILRAGGTDAQWFWFPGEPKGLAALREQREGKGVRDGS